MFEFGVGEMETAVREMRGLERAVEWLRPFVEQHGWDYCVIWKSGGDPSRYVEFVDCCCAGGYVSGDVKLEKSGDQNGVASPVCRDVHVEHPIRTKACETLAQIPAALPLYSGIHSDVAITNQPNWLSEDDRTLVLIPLGGGLIELFAAKLVEKDQTTIDFIRYQYTVSLEHDALLNHLHPNVDQVVHETELGHCLQNSSPGVLFIDTAPKLQPVVPLKKPQTRASFPGSSTGSNPPNENPSMDSSFGHLSQDASLPPSSSNSPCSKKPKICENFSKSQPGAASAPGNIVFEKGNPKFGHKPGKEGSKAKNLEVERRRRSRIKDGEFQLRALVPNISKMDRASIIGDAITYIIELKKTVQELEQELKEEDDENVDPSVELSGKQKAGIRFKRGIPDADLRSYSEMQVEVHQICGRTFLLRVVAEQQPCWSSRLMQAMSSLGLHVEDANINTCHGLVLCNFRVEVNSEVQPNQLRDSLIKELDTIKMN
uniref:BHLH domain-containing protein n=1 Tax=Kalanchoe fedtschenkoi TaxID=63787 RepID=A0A7N0TF04_KALFE